MIAVVIVEHDHNRQLVLLANSQGRQSGIIIECAIANQTENRPFGKGSFDSQSGARTRAESSDATGKK